jgi:beta-fructofuranosidase
MRRGAARVNRLRPAEVGLSKGATVGAVCKGLGINDLDRAVRRKARGRDLMAEGLSPEGDLLQEPAGDYQSLRGEGVSVGETVLPANQEVVLDNVRGNSMELEAEIAPQDAPSLELNVLRSPGRGETTRISIYPHRGFNCGGRGGRPGEDTVVSIDTSYSSELPDVANRPPETAPVYIPAGEPIRLHMFVDRSIVEVFVNGRQCLGVRVYPGREDSVGVSLRAQGCDAVLRSLKAWPMRSAGE